MDEYTMYIPVLPTKMKFAFFYYFFYRLFRNLFLARPTLMFGAVATGGKIAAGLLKESAMLSVCKDYSLVFSLRGGGGQLASIRDVYLARAASD